MKRKHRPTQQYPMVRAGIPCGSLPVSDIRQLADQTREDKMARRRARRAAQIMEDEAIEAAIDEYVRDHQQFMRRFTPPDFTGPEAA